MQNTKNGSFERRQNLPLPSNVKTLKSFRLNYKALLSDEELCPGASPVTGPHRSFFYIGSPAFSLNVKPLKSS